MRRAGYSKLSRSPTVAKVRCAEHRITEANWRLHKYEQRQFQEEDMGISIERARFDFAWWEKEYAQQIKDIESQREVYFPKAELVGIYGGVIKRPLRRRKACGYNFWKRN